MKIRREKIKKRIDNFLKAMSKIFYDIVPPKRKRKKFVMSLKNIKIEKNQSFFTLARLSVLKVVVFLVIVSLNWTGLSAVLQTNSYMSDVETAGSSYTAGTLDFELSSAQVFSNAVLSPGSSVTGIVSVINLDNVPQYKLKSANLSGGLCDYLNLEANLDGGAIEYSGKLKDIDFGPVVFASPDDWSFVLSLPADAPNTVIGETCNFNFVFYGSQVRNNLQFGQGFNDTEDTAGSVKAKMCFDSQTSSCSYWKNHPNVYKPYLPQKLGNEIIDTATKADNVLKSACGNGNCGCGNDCDKTMKGKLKGQLLTMKFNVAHYGMGEYIPNGDTRTINQIIVEADNLLKQVPTPSDSVLEAMKDLLGGLNQDLQIRVCTDTGVKVLIPNGGEKWWVGQYYDLTWLTKNLNCPDDLTQISIWYSGDGGNTWGNITTNTEDDGVYNWRIPLYLPENYYVPSEKSRIKVVAVCSENLMVAGWDMSDYDFCPPIDYSLLTDEEKAQVEQLLADGTLSADEVINREVPIPETPVVEDENSTTESIPEAVLPENDNSTTENSGTPVSIPAEITNGSNNPTTDQTITETETVTDQTTTDQTTTDQIQAVTEETTNQTTTDQTTTETTKDQTTIDQTTTETTTEPVIEEQPMVEQQSVVVPDDNSGEQIAPPADGGDSTASDAGSTDDGTPSVDSGSSDSGSSGE